MNGMFWGFLLFFAVVAIIRITMHKVMTPEQLERYDQRTKEQNRKFLEGGAEVGKAIFDAWKKRR